jgi:pyrimidine-nucleoside phosphorylase
MMGQTAEIAPVDRRLYALRDATATIDSVPLIAASIMSKKLAEGLTALVLDVKRGSGGFLASPERGLELAHLMVSIGRARRLPVVALITAMDRPLGRACGSALEVEEAVQALRGDGPPDLLRVTYALGAEMLVLAGVCESHEAAHRAMEVAISSGKAAERFARIVEAQGGDPTVVDDPSCLPQSGECELYYAERSGVVATIEPRTIGLGVIALGGGRTRMDDRVDHSVGFVIGARPGDFVRKAEPLATIFARDKAGVAQGAATLRRAIRIGDEADLPLPLISHRVSAAGADLYREGEAVA